MKWFLNLFFVVSLLGMFFLSIPRLSASMTGGAFELYADTFSIADGFASSTDYTLEGTGAFSSATSTGGAYELRGGFQAQEKGILTLSLSTTTLNLGVLSVSQVTTSSPVLVSVSTDSETGYSLSIAEDGNFRSGVHDINDVADNDVTAGNEEYGMEVTGTDRASTLPAGDQPVIGPGTTIANRTGGVTNRETTIKFLAAINSSVMGGLTYSHQVTFTLTVNP